MKPLITIGCKTDHGGVVVEVDSTFQIEGKPVHLEGMKHFCPKCKKVVSAVSLGKGFLVVGSKTIIMAGDKTTCGATFLPQHSLVSRDAGSGSGCGSSSSASSSFSSNVAKIFDEQIVAVDETGNLLPDISYYIKTAEGKVYKGKTDIQGKTPRIETTSSNELHIWLGEDAEVMIDMEQNNG